MYVKLLHNHYDPQHLAEVKAEMLTLGTPTIRVIDGGDMYYAVEGCHRLRAAAELGIEPDFVVVGEASEPVEIEGFEPDGGDWYEELCGWAIDSNEDICLSFAA
jgi:hypothetical protein